MLRQFRRSTFFFTAFTAALLSFIARPAYAQFIYDAIVTGQYGFTIDLKVTQTLHDNTAALAAFQRGALEWADQFTNSTTIIINADVSNLGSSSIIGSTGSAQGFVGYSTARSALQAQVGDNVAVQNLPTTLTANVPSGYTFDGTTLRMNSANAKVLGLNTGNNVDAQISFNSNFAFDYDSSNGVDAGKEDFQTVAAHEIGHALGFTSSVDIVDTSSSGTIQASTLDLYRFSSANLPTTAAQFASNARDLVPGSNDFTSDILEAYAMSTGQNKGDGFQASHWKADDITGNFIGIMDPSLADGVTERVNNHDLLAMHLIGYNIVSTETPEPASLALLGLGAAPLLGVTVRRRQMATAV